MFVHPSVDGSMERICTLPEVERVSRWRACRRKGMSEQLRALYSLLGARKHPRGAQEQIGADAVAALLLGGSGVALAASPPLASPPPAAQQASGATQASGGKRSCSRCTCGCLIVGSSSCYSGSDCAARVFHSHGRRVYSRALVRLQASSVQWSHLESLAWLLVLIAGARSAA